MKHPKNSRMSLSESSAGSTMSKYVMKFINDIEESFGRIPSKMLLHFYKEKMKMGLIMNQCRYQGEYPGCLDSTISKKAVCRISLVSIAETVKKSQQITERDVTEGLEFPLIVHKSIMMKFCGISV